MNNTETPPVTPERIMQLSWGYAPPLILEAAIRHRVFDILEEGPKPLPELSRATSTSARGLAAIVDALVGLQFLAKDSEGRFSLTPESSTFLVSTKPGFQGALLRHCSRIIPPWLQLSDIVATGRPALAVNQQGEGTAFFKELVPDILPLSYPAAQILAQHLNVSGRSARVLDIAAGSGVWGIAFAQASQQARVTALDWPDMIPITRRVVHQFGVGDQFSYIEGDLLEADFGASYNVATLGHILHSEGEERSRKLLAKVSAALDSGGVIAIAEFLVNQERTAPPGSLLFAVNMLVNTDRGNTFSFEEISRWLEEAGFVQARTLEAPGPSPLILATKP